MLDFYCKEMTAREAAPDQPFGGTLIV